jgi:hypothetical protein
MIKAQGPILAVWLDRFLQNMLDFLVGDFYLATSLSMVGSGYFVCNGVLEKQGFKKPVAKVLTSCH